MFENLCFISDILRKNHGHVIVKMYGNGAVNELYNGSVLENLAEWIRFCDDHMLSIGSGGYDVEDKIYLIGEDYFEDDVDDENDK